MESGEHWLDRLSDYLDGELDERDRMACEAHVARCRECADAAEGLRAVVAQASLLPPIAASRDLWPGIEGRLQPRGSVESTAAPSAGLRPSRHFPSRSLPSRVRSSRWTLTEPQLAAAGIALVVLTAGMMWLLVPAAGSESVASGGSTDQSVQLADAGDDSARGVFLVAYAPAISELEQEYEARRALLEPETRRVVEENLAIIDRAIAEAERALAEDPTNAFVTTHLAGAMRQKVDLLRRVTSIPSKES